MIYIICRADMTPVEPDAYYSERYECPICGFEYPEDWL